MNLQEFFDVINAYPDNAALHVDVEDITHLLEDVDRYIARLKSAVLDYGRVMPFAMYGELTPATRELVKELTSEVLGVVISVDE